jgi:serine/threonine protein phosphatase PrpC
VHFTTITCSEKGPREEQQDAAGVVSQGDRLLAVVCDGAGGHRGGSRASKLAVQVACEAFEKVEGKFEDPKTALIEICRTAHEEILKLGETPKLAPRSTIVAVYLNGQKTHMVHVGDSRIYHLRSGKIIERTRDHTMVQILLEQGEVKESEMGTHPDQGRLLRALGSDEELRPTYGSAELTEDDAFLLCSDGFWERTSPEETQKLFQARPTQARLEGNIRRAIERNGPKGDNVTALAVFSARDKSGSVSYFLRWQFLVPLLLVIIYLIWQFFFSMEKSLFPDRDRQTEQRRVTPFSHE